jgi:hypothetical protein
MPVVTIAILPTFVPEEIETLKVVAALGEPMACEPKFSLADAPAKLTCARPDGESSRTPKIIGRSTRQKRFDVPTPETNSNIGMMETSLSGEGSLCFETGRQRINSNSPFGASISVFLFFVSVHLRLLTLCIGT